MKRILKSAYNNSVLLMETVISLFSVFFFSRFFVKRNLRELIYKKHDHCYIITNGPSLKKVFEKEIEKNIFAGQDIFTVNLFYQSTIFYEIKPANHIIADNAFWDVAWDSRIEGIQKTFKENLLRVTWDINLFVPFAGFSILKKILESNEKITLVPYNHTPVGGYKGIAHFLYRKNLGMPRPSNVLNAAIFMALNLGYKKIYIYGADHSWMKDLFVDENNNICCYENHFYDDVINPYKMPKGSLAEGLRGIVEAFESYKILNVYSKSIDSQIINKTKGSYIDVFDYE